MVNKNKIYYNYCKIIQISFFYIFCKIERFYTIKSCVNIYKKKKCCLNSLTNKNFNLVIHCKLLILQKKVSNISI